MQRRLVPQHDAVSIHHPPCLMQISMQRGWQRNGVTAADAIDCNQKPDINGIKWPNIPQTDIFALDSLDHCLLLPQRSLAKGKH